MKYLHLFGTEDEFNEERFNDYKEPWLSLTLKTDKPSERADTIVTNSGYNFIRNMSGTTVHWFDGEYTYNSDYSYEGESAYTNSNNMTIWYDGGNGCYFYSDAFQFDFTGYSLNGEILTTNGCIQTYGVKVDSSAQLIHTYDGTYIWNDATQKYEKDGFVLDMYDDGTGSFDYVEEANIVVITQYDEEDGDIMYVFGGIPFLNDDYAGTYTYDHYDVEKNASAFTKDDITLYVWSNEGISIGSAYIIISEGEEEYEYWNVFKPSYTAILDRVDYNKTERDRLLEVPLTFEIISGGTIYWRSNYDGGRSIEYKKNDGEWIAITASQTNPPSISVVAGDTVQFRGNNMGYITNHFNTDSQCRFNAKGNIMSLINSTDFQYLKELSQSVFQELFSECIGLTDASNLILPATTLGSGCYNSMFYDCTSLTTAPELPAKILADGCYNSMFYNCSSLTTAPELPATTLAQTCYSHMFCECTSLVTAPSVLPATTLENRCYGSMFSYCNSLTTAPELPATTLADYCYQYMFMNCVSLVTAPSVLPATTLTNYCYYNMFSYCTSLTTAPELPATTLAQNCYRSMFQGCINLVNAPELPATTLENRCYEGMFMNCTNLNYIKCLATNISGNSYTNNWVYGVQTSSGTFVKDANMTGWSTGVNGIPVNWEVRNDIDEK